MLTSEIHWGASTLKRSLTVYLRGCSEKNSVWPLMSSQSLCVKRQQRRMFVARSKQPQHHSQSHPQDESLKVCWATFVAGKHPDLYNSAGGTGKNFLRVQAETEEETQKKRDNRWARKKRTAATRQTKSSAGWMFYLQKSTRRWGRNQRRGSAGAGDEGTPGLAELIAMMDWSNSPEHGALAPAITQQDDFASLHVRQLWKNFATICNC